MSGSSKLSVSAVSKKSHPLTPKQWAEAEALWGAGEVTLDQLAKRFKKSKSTFEKHFSRRGLKKGFKAEAIQRKITTAVESSIVDDTTVIASRIRETKEEHYKMAAGLAKLTWSEILTVKQNGAPMASAMNNLKALDSAMSVLKKAREERYAVLGLDRADYVDEGGLPELVIAELTADQIEELRNRDSTEFDELGDVIQSDNGIDLEDDMIDDDTVEEEGA